MDTLQFKCKAVCNKVNRSSQSAAFRNLYAGDVIEFTTTIEAAGRNRSTYATYITCFNIRTNQESRLSFNQIGKVLECGDFEQIS